MNNRIRIATWALVGAVLAGCATMEMSEENKAALGATMGAIAGVLIANEAGANNWQTVLAGVAVGYAGYRIGKRLGRNDQAALHRRTAYALANAPDGRSLAWASTESDATATITTRNTREEVKSVDILRDERMTTPPALDIIGKSYTSLGSSVNLRAAPSTSAPVIGSLHKGEVVQAIGKVRNAPWVMISKNAIAMGYVHASLIAEHDESQAQRQASLTRTLELDDVDMEEVNRQAQATLEIDDFVAVGDTIEVETDCRTVDIEIVVQAQAENESVDACLGPNGSWEAV